MYVEVSFGNSRKAPYFGAQLSGIQLFFFTLFLFSATWSANRMAGAPSAIQNQEMTYFIGVSQIQDIRAEDKRA